MNKPLRKQLCIAVAVQLLLAVFFSCSNNSERTSFTNQLDQIDALINQKQYKDAARELGKAEKMAYGSWAEIGLFRRYVQIQMIEKAEKLILGAIKKNPENQELNAVYTNFLLRNNRVSDALTVGKILQGTKYGSIYSEAVMCDTLEKSSEKELRTVFHSAEYFPVYMDAYNGSKNSFWLRNCALLRLSNGSYEGAASIHPGEVYSAEDAYFWALIMYDAKRYGNCVNYSNAAVQLLPSVTGRAESLVSLSKLSLLLQDSYTWLGDVDLAENVRAAYLESIDDKKGSWKIPEDEENSESLPVIFVNSARWANANEQDHKAAKLLFFCVEKWPDYVPGLTGYADFAYKSNLMRKENLAQMMLRDEGLATLEMEKYDSRAKIPLSDAIFRIDESLKRNKDPLLFIVQLDLRYKVESKLNETERHADMWRVLEKNAESPSVYPELLFCYALNYFLENKMYEQSWQLFYKYISNKYGVPADDNFWTEVIRKIYTFTGREAEFAAYFATLSLRSEDAVRLNEYCVFENGEDGESEFISPAVSDKTCVNLAMIYHSVGRNRDSMDLYGKINGRCADSELKSVVMYRMGLIYFEQNDFRNARRCAEYSISLNSRNVDAKMLLTKIKQLSDNLN